MTIRASNTAIPEQYAIFREEVLSGLIPISREISQEMNRIDARIADPTIYYDARPVGAFIRFCEAEMTKTDGTDLRLLDSFKLWAEQLFGWHVIADRTIFVANTNGVGGSFEVVPHMKRLITKQYLIVARGGAKSMYLSMVQAYFLIIHSDTTHQITTAPVKYMAEEVMAPIRTAIIRSRGPLFKFLTAKTRVPNDSNYSGARAMLLASKKGIESLLTGSVLEVRPMAIAKLQGLRPMVSTVDEWLSSDTREDVIGALEQGASKLDTYVIVAASSEGTVRNGSGDDMKLELAKILSGEYPDEHTSIFHYKLDSIEEVGNPDLWLKANPNLGITVSYEAYAKDVKRAEHAPANRNDIIAKRFNIPMAGFTYFFTYEETLVHPPKNFRDMVCSLGGDMSQGDDFCSFAFLFPMRPHRFGMKTLNFITTRTLDRLKPAARIKYQEFLDEGSLIVLEGTVLNMMEVYEVLMDHIYSNGYVVHAFGYDPYNADALVTKYKQDNGPYGIEVVRQGSRTESVPLGEIKALTEDGRLIFDQKIVEYAMGNTMVEEDNNGNRKLYKKRYDAKIDPVAALMDAYVAYSRHPDEFS